MDDNMNPATTVDPQAASQQGTLDSFSSTPRYVRLPHVVHDSRGGRGLPFARLTASPHFHQDTQGRGGSSATARFSNPAGRAVASLGGA